MLFELLAAEERPYNHRPLHGAKQAVMPTYMRIEHDSMQAAFEPLAPAPVVRVSTRVRGLIDRLDAVEIDAVRRQVAFADRLRLGRVAVAISVLGDGWIYPLVSAALVLIDGRAAGTTVLTSGAAVVAAHSLYPFCKKAIARQRPFVTYTDVTCRRTPLDYYSFPSGHCMTMCAAFLPVALSHPAIGIGLAGFALCLAWSRVVLGHHYPSDVIGGAFMGLIGYVLTNNLLFWTGAIG